MDIENTISVIRTALPVAEHTIREVATLFGLIGKIDPESIANRWGGDSHRIKKALREIHVFLEMKRQVKETGLPFKAVRWNTLFPLLDAAALNDETEPGGEDMFKRWASLLANAVVESDLVPPAFPEILKQLTPVDARLFEYLERLSRSSFSLNLSDFYNACYELGICIPGSPIGSLRFRTDDPPLSHLDNLLRVRLVEEVPNLAGQWVKIYEVLQRKDSTYGGLDTPDFSDVKPGYRITELGKHFYNACQPPMKPQDQSSQR